MGAGDRDRSRCSLGCVNQWTNSREATKDGVLVPSALAGSALRADVRDAASFPVSGVGPAAAQRPCSWGQRTCGTPPGPRTVPRGRASPSEGWRPGLTPLLTPPPPTPYPCSSFSEGKLKLSILQLPRTKTCLWSFESKGESVTGLKILN